MNNIIDSLVNDDPDGEKRKFVLKPYFRESFKTGGLCSAFSQGKPSSEMIELAFISEAYEIDPHQLVREIGFNRRQVGFDNDSDIPSGSDLISFMRGRDWQMFTQTSSIGSYKNIVDYDDTEVFPEKVIPSNIKMDRPEKLVSDLLKVNSGVAIGDDHGEVCVTDFIQTELPAMQRQGVGTIYFEMIESEHQNALDQYMETGDPKIIEDIISYGWANKSPGMKQHYFDVIEAARDAGVRVVAIDRAEMGNRFHDSNPHWVDVIEKDREQRPLEEKFIVYGGHYHFCEAPDYDCHNFPVNSVSKSLGIPSVKMTTGNEVIEVGTQSDHNDFMVSLKESPRQRRHENERGANKRDQNLVARQILDPSAYAKMSF